MFCFVFFSVHKLKCWFRVICVHFTICILPLCRAVFCNRLGQLTSLSQKLPETLGAVSQKIPLGGKKIFPLAPLKCGVIRGFFRYCSLKLANNHHIWSKQRFCQRSRKWHCLLESDLCTRKHFTSVKIAVRSFEKFKGAQSH